MTETSVAGPEVPGGAGEVEAASIRTVFIGLVLGMFLGAVNMTIVAPAMPRIVAQLGGMEHYSWIAVSSLLASTVIVPIVGKLSDLYGRKAFYVGGICVFMLSCLVAALAPTFEIFMVGRVLEGFGMGTMMPLSQAIIGDLVPPRERGKYQGMMGGVFGLASVVGPFVGGWITDTLSWHWLFFVNIPLGIIALGFIIPFMKLPHTRRAHRVDYAGFVTLTVGLTAFLLAIVLGGTTFPWASPQIVGLFGVGIGFLVLFLWVETRAEEPVMPLRLWRNSIFATANVATLCVAAAMFGAIYYIPVFMQGVQGASVTGSGAALTPMMLSLVGMSALKGAVISRTGRYKVNILVGLALLAAGCFLLTTMDRTTSNGQVVRNMVLIGLGLGAAMQTFVLVVQNAVSREDLGVATATTQLSRSIGSSLGTAILGTLLAQGMTREMARVGVTGLPTGGGGGELGAGSLLDPELLARLSPAALEGVRAALAAALQPVFLATLPPVILAIGAALVMRELPLRRGRPAEEATEAGREILAEMGHAGADDAGPVLGRPTPEYRERTAFLGLAYALLAARARQDGTTHLDGLVGRFGGGDVEAGTARLEAVARALLRECDEGPGDCGHEVLTALGGRDGQFPPGLDPATALERAAAQRPAELRTRLNALVTDRNVSPAAILTPGDLGALERIGVILSAALLLDLGTSDGGGKRREGNEPPP